MTVGVSIATVYSGVYFDYFLSFFSLFLQFLPLRLYKEDNPLLFCAFLFKYVSKNKFICFSMSSLSAVRL